VRLLSLVDVFPPSDPVAPSYAIIFLFMTRALPDTVASTFGSMATAYIWYFSILQLFVLQNTPLTAFQHNFGLFTPGRAAGELVQQLCFDFQILRHIHGQDVQKAASRCGSGARRIASNSRHHR
jgi:hypothetical protein